MVLRLAEATKRGGQKKLPPPATSGVPSGRAVPLGALVPKVLPELLGSEQVVEQKAEGDTSSCGNEAADLSGLKLECMICAYADIRDDQWYLCKHCPWLLCFDCAERNGKLTVCKGMLYSPAHGLCEHPAAYVVPMRIPHQGHQCCEMAAR